MECNSNGSQDGCKQNCESFAVYLHAVVMRFTERCFNVKDFDGQGLCPTLVTAWSEFENKNSFIKKSERSKENSSPQAEHFLGFMKCFSKFAKRIYETTNRNFFNVPLTINTNTVVLVFFNSTIHIISTFCQQ